MIITGCNEVVAKVIFLHLFVILFTGGGGVCLGACWDTTPLGSRHPPRADNPPEQMSPGSRHHPGSRHPLGADTSPRADFPPGADPPPQQTPPWKADSGIRSMSGRYASYWNAFLFISKGEHKTTEYHCIEFFNCVS